jgi:hypothetical protein
MAGIAEQAARAELHAPQTAAPVAPERPVAPVGSHRRRWPWVAAATLLVAGIGAAVFVGQFPGEPPTPPAPPEKTAASYFRDIRAAFDRKNFAAMKAAIDEGLRRFPEDAPLWTQRGHYYLANGSEPLEVRKRETLRSAEEALRLAPSARTRADLGWVYQEMYDDCGNALRYYEQAWDLADRNPTILFHAAVCYLKEGNQRSAAINYSRFLQRGTETDLRGKADEALSALFDSVERADRLDPQPRWDYGPCAAAAYDAALSAAHSEAALSHASVASMHMLVWNTLDDESGNRLDNALFFVRVAASDDRTGTVLVMVQRQGEGPWRPAVTDNAKTTPGGLLLDGHVGNQELHDFMRAGNWQMGGQPRQLLRGEVRINTWSRVIGERPQYVYPGQG